MGDERREEKKTVICLAVHDDGSRGRLSQQHRLSLIHQAPPSLDNVYAKEGGAEFHTLHMHKDATHSPHGSAGGFPGLLRG